MNKKNIVFLGTPFIAKRALEVLNNIEWINILFVVSQPDRELDRKKNLVFQDVKKYCIEKNIKIYQPEKISEIKDILIESKPDALITCAYGQFVPDSILNIPKYGAYNFHASLLPKLRGGAPIHYAIINQEKTTGWSLMKMVKKMDAGDYCAQSIVNIDPNWTTKDLYVQLCNNLDIFINDNIHLIFDKSTNWIAQNEKDVSFAYNITKEQSIINFNQTSKEINAFIKGLYDKPIAIWKYNNMDIKVYYCSISSNKSTISPGKISKIDKNGIHISTNDYDIIIEAIKLPSKNLIYIKDVFHNKEWLKGIFNEEI